jgi:hypothetical protein
MMKKNGTLNLIFQCTFMIMILHLDAIYYERLTVKVQLRTTPCKIDSMEYILTI